MEVRMKFRN